MHKKQTHFPTVTYTTQTLGYRYGPTQKKQQTENYNKNWGKNTPNQQKIINLTKSRTTNINDNINFSRVVIYTNTQFAQEETQLLQNLE
jgi:hypothetical protein